MVLPARLAAVLFLTSGLACGSDTDERPPEWSYIVRAILRPNCATSSCHSARAATGEVELEEPHEAYVSLVGEPNHVVPGDLAASKLVHLLRGDEVWRMPPDQPLPEADIQLIERWILAGAQEN